MKVLFLTDGSGLGIPKWLKGHDVKVYSSRSGSPLDGKNLVDRVHSWRPSVLSSDFIICDSPRFGQYDKFLRGNARPLMGCSPESALLSIDLRRSHQIFKLAGIPTQEIKSLVNGTGLLLHQTDDNGKESVYRASDLIEQQVLERSIMRSNYIAQEIPKSFPISVTMFWNGRELSNPFLLTNEFSSMKPPESFSLPGGGSYIKSLDKKSKLVKRLQGLSKFLEKTTYRGAITSNLLVNSVSIKGSSLVMGCPSILLASLARKEPTLLDRLYKLTLGNDVTLTDKLDCSVQIYSREKPIPDLPIFIPETYEPRMLPISAYKQESRYFTGSATDAFALCSSATEVEGCDKITSEIHSLFADCPSIATARSAQGKLKTMGWC